MVNSVGQPPSIIVGVAWLSIALFYLFNPLLKLKGTGSTWVDAESAPNISRRSWTSIVAGSNGTTDAEVIAEIKKNTRVPVIITGSPATAWAALERWEDPSYLASKFPDGKVHGVVSRPDGFFIAPSRGYHRKLDPFVSATAQDTIVGTAAVSDFFEPNGPRLYVTGKLDKDPQLRLLQPDVHPKDFLEHPVEDFVGAYMFLGSGSTANTHLDETSNVVVMMMGRKHVSLFAPTQWYDLHLHPFHHPRRHQSQRYFPEIENLAPSSVVVPWGVSELSPGEALVLPPFWFHRFRCLSSPAASLATWHVSPELEALKWVETQAPPNTIQRQLFPNEFSPPPRGKALDTNMGGMALYVRLLGEELLALSPGVGQIHVGDLADLTPGNELDLPTASRLLIRAVVTSRYLSLTPSMVEREPNLGCGPKWSTRLCPLKAKALPTKDHRDTRSRAHEVVSGLWEQLKDVDNSAGHLDGVLGMIFSDYIEHMATMAAGPTMVCEFLSCVAHEGAWKRTRSSVVL
mmetsp:Transcript_13825/g.25330  ORF Transcript_13825/g.25330 Transcript_13825/m.25330 type:complete len:516 (+) Transcript_13825:60-1607(+)